MEEKYKYIRFFKEIGVDDVAVVGGKTSSVGEMYRELTPQGVKVANGFAITAAAYRYILDKASAWDALHEALEGIDASNMADLANRGRKARAIVYGAPLPDDLKQEILAAYQTLQGEYGHDLSVAVRSSATAEDLPNVSFAGQHESYLNIYGDVSCLSTLVNAALPAFSPTALSITALTRGSTTSRCTSPLQS